MPAVPHRDGRPHWVRYGWGVRLARYAGLLLALLVLLLCWRYVSERTIWAFVLDAPATALDIGSRAVPPDLGYVTRIGRATWDTVNTATLGTLLGMVLAVPFAFLAARPTTPHGAVRALALLVIVASRSINSLVWALLFVAILGPGVLAGILAIGLRSIGFIGKLLYEAIEEIDPAQVEAIRATGASPPLVLAYGIAPQVMPAFAGISVFRWDINIRESAILGLVGAGGLGLHLDDSVSRLAWNQTATILLVILALVAVSEWVSATVRRRYI